MPIKAMASSNPERVMGDRLEVAGRGQDNRSAAVSSCFGDPVADPGLGQLLFVTRSEAQTTVRSTWTLSPEG